MKKLLMAMMTTALVATTASFAENPTPPAVKMDAPKKVKMRIKAKEKNGVVKAKVSIKHPMLTYDQAKKKGVDVNFITHITATVGDKVVYDASTSQFLSKNPLVKFEFKNAKKGDMLKVVYTDWTGAYYAEKKIK